MMRRMIAMASLVLAIASISRYRNDQHARIAAEAFLRQFDVHARRPADAETLPLVPAADLGANVTGDIALEDALGTVRLSEMTPEMRERWMRAVGRLDAELTSARDLTLDALAVRPGWPRHWTMLGSLVYTMHRRDSAAAADARLWQEPLRIAMHEAPGDDVAATFSAGAALESWPELTDAARSRAIASFPRALLDPQFASRTFPMLLAAVGADRAIAMMPPQPGTLRAAFDSFAAAGDIERAGETFARWERAEWSARAAGLDELEARARLGDIERQRELAAEWLYRHPATDFDSPAGREQVLRVLQLAVNDRIGTWQSDPRAAAVRFFMHRRLEPGGAARRGIEIAPGGAVVAAVVNSLTGVPEPSRARAQLLGGDVEGARSMFERSDSAGSFEWTPFLLDLAEYRIATHSLNDAEGALEALAPGARDECDARIVRRKLAKLTGETTNVSVPEATQYPANAWSATGVLTICVDPEAAEMQQLSTSVDARAPALVAWGWNDGRHGSFYVAPGRTTLRVPLAGRGGRQAFFVRTLAGAQVVPGAAGIAR